MSHATEADPMRTPEQRRRARHINAEVHASPYTSFVKGLPDIPSPPRSSFTGSFGAYPPLASPGQAGFGFSTRLPPSNCDESVSYVGDSATKFDFGALATPQKGHPQDGRTAFSPQLLQSPLPLFQHSPARQQPSSGPRRMLLSSPGIAVEDCSQQGESGAPLSGPRGSGFAELFASPRQGGGRRESNASDGSWTVLLGSQGRGGDSGLTDQGPRAVRASVGGGAMGSAAVGQATSTPGVRGGEPGGRSQAGMRGAGPSGNNGHAGHAASAMDLGSGLERLQALEPRGIVPVQSSGASDPSSAAHGLPMDADQHGSRGLPGVAGPDDTSKSDSPVATGLAPESGFSTPQRPRAGRTRTTPGNDDGSADGDPSSTPRRVAAPLGPASSPVFLIPELRGDVGAVPLQGLDESTNRLFTAASPQVLKPDILDSPAVLRESRRAIAVAMERSSAAVAAAAAATCSPVRAPSIGLTSSIGGSRGPSPALDAALARSRPPDDGMAAVNPALPQRAQRTAAAGVLAVTRAIAAAEVAAAPRRVHSAARSTASEAGSDGGIGGGEIDATTALFPFVPPTAPGPRKCNCKKSKCLKLYCDCFAAGGYCGPACTCAACANREQNAAAVQIQREAIMQRTPHAFDRKIAASGSGGAGQHRRGCNCKKSACMKKYCECFQAGIPCGEACKCEGCMNTTAATAAAGGAALAARRGAPRDPAVLKRTKSSSGGAGPPHDGMQASGAARPGTRGGGRAAAARHSLDPSTGGLTGATASSSRSSTLASSEDGANGLGSTAQGPTGLARLMPFDPEARDAVGLGAIPQLPASGPLFIMPWHLSACGSGGPVDAGQRPAGMSIDPISLPMLWPGTQAPLQFAHYATAATFSRHLAVASGTPGQLVDPGPDNMESETPLIHSLGRGLGDAYQQSDGAPSETPVTGILPAPEMAQSGDFLPETTERSFTFPVKSNSLANGRMSLPRNA